MPGFKHRDSSPIFLVLLLLFAVAGLAQEKPGKPEEQVGTIRLDTDLVSIDVAVSDRAGSRSVAGLKAADFVVYEDGVRQKIAAFSAEDVPFNLVLLLDTSGSTREDVTTMRRAARRFLDELRPRDRVAVVQFNREVELLKDLTSDRERIEEALERLKPGTGTSYYDALLLTIDEVFKGVSGRRAIVALTDGVDSFGYTTYREILAKLEAAGASAYFLELDTESFTEVGMMRDCQERNHFEFSPKQLKKYREEYARDAMEVDYGEHCRIAKLERMQINRRLYESARRELREIASKTGGRVYPVKDLRQLEPAYSQIAAELHTLYTLAYYPANERRDGKWRRLKVDLKRPGFEAHTRPGYRAPRD
ncbi:MAG: VWA domain-containing protein [Blastocatellia bacterium]